MQKSRKTPTVRCASDWRLSGLRSAGDVHRKMNPLGTPFESYDDFGRYREQIVLGDADAYFKAKRKYEGDLLRTQDEIAGWKSLDESGRADKVRHAEAMLNRLSEPQPGTENYPAAKRRYEADTKRWNDEREKWLGTSDEDQQRKIADLERRLADLDRTGPGSSAGRFLWNSRWHRRSATRWPGGGRRPISPIGSAKSDRVRQSFVRHAFRYWMGRNETLADSPTLMAADRAYAENGGSFRALLVSLLTSDSFLYRK